MSASVCVIGAGSGAEVPLVPAFGSLASIQLAAPKCHRSQADHSVLSAGLATPKFAANLRCRLVSANENDKLLTRKASASSWTTMVANRSLQSGRESNVARGSVAQLFYCVQTTC